MLKETKKHYSYLKYVLRHKWFVFVECIKEGIPLRGLLHDLSKFLPSEWFPYANHFYGDKKYKDTTITQTNTSDKGGYIKPPTTGDIEFDLAWLHHQKRNKHHWQYWVLRRDTGESIPCQMDHKYAIEMICDWIGAEKANGRKDQPNEVISWYNKHKSNMRLHKSTQHLIELILERKREEHNEVLRKSKKST